LFLNPNNINSYFALNDYRTFEKRSLKLGIFVAVIGSPGVKGCLEVPGFKPTISDLFGALNNVCFSP